MACSLPPELDVSELLVYLDDKTDREVAAHLEQCPHCHARAQRLAHMQDRLTAGLYRVTCPSPTELGEYHLGVLPRDQGVAVARHLTDCPHCSREVAQLTGYLDELAADIEFGPLDRIKIWVAELVGGTGADRPGTRALAPAFAGIRGDEEGPRIYQAGDVQIAVDVQDDATQPDRKMVLGLITGIELHELTGHLWLAGEHVAKSAVDDLGNLIIGNLEPGDYLLILSGSDLEIQIQDLDVRTS
jgi:hypothetical protein